MNRIVSVILILLMCMLIGGSTSTFADEKIPIQRTMDVINPDMELKEARRLAKLFPDRYKLYAKIIKRGHKETKEIFWRLEEIKDYSLQGVKLFQNIEYPPGGKAIPLDNYQPCFWDSLCEKNLIYYL